MNFTSCCVNDDIHCCKSTLITDFGTGLRQWTLPSLLYTDLVAKTWGRGSGPGNVGQSAKAVWALWAHKTKGSFHWWCLGRVLLVAGDCTWLKHPLLLCLGHFTAPCLVLVLPCVQLVRGTAREVPVQMKWTPLYRLCLWIFWCASAAGSQHQEIPKGSTEDGRGAARGREDSVLCRDQVIHGHLRQRWHKGDTWATIRHSVSQAARASSTSLMTLRQEGGTSHTRGEDIPVPSAYGQTQVSLQAPREVR